MITSSNADFDEDGFGSVVRDLERAYLMLAELGVQGGDSPASTVINYNSELGGGNATMTPANMGNTLFSSRGSSITGVTGGITKIPDLVGDVIGSITANVIANGAVTAAKMANSIGCSVIARWDNSTGVLGSLQATTNNTVLKRTANTLTFDKVNYAEMQDIVGLSVVGRAANSTGVMSAITATNDNTVLKRVSGSLSWNKINYAEIQDVVGVSVIGRSTNSTGVSAAISASSDGQVLQRLSGILQFAPIQSPLNIGAVGSASGTINLYNTGNNYRSLLDYQKLEIYTVSISDSIPLVQIYPASISPTGGWTTTKQITIKEVDAAEAGVAKKILILCSNMY